MSSSSEIRPKSSATVVVTLSGTWPVRSISAATSVMAASVVSTGISEMLATVVVLPTPKPPATTIFTGTGRRRRRCAVAGGGYVVVTSGPDAELEFLDQLRREERTGAVGEDRHLVREIAEV